MATSSTSEIYPWLSTVNVANFVSVRPSLNMDNLDRSIKDYKIWKEQMVCLLESQGLLSFVNGHVPPPEESVDEHNLRRRTDRMIKGWILGSINGTDVLDTVVGLKSSREVWLKLENIFKAESSVNASVTGMDLSQHSELYKAALMGKWWSAWGIWSKNDVPITAIINNYSETVLHVAVGARNSIFFVKMLLDCPMENQALLLKNGAGNNALHVAAIVGNTEAAQLLVKKYSDLLYTFGENDKLPVHLAALYSHKDTLEYLISVSEQDVENSPIVGRLGASLLNITIASGFIDVALNLVQKYTDLATLCDGDGDYALQVMAGMKSVFPSGESFSWWQNWIYSCLPLKPFDLRGYTFDIENQSSAYKLQQNLNWFQKIVFVVPGAKRIHDKKVMHRQALDLVKNICRELEMFPFFEVEGPYERAIITAARNGIHEVVEVITKVFPRAIYVKEPETGGYIFHVAARERFESVFNLLNCMNNKRQFFFDSVDYSDNNFMHLCAELAPHHKLNLISGAALQMQRELQWFKEMEKFVNPSRRTWRNKAGKTPQMLFTEKHQDLKSQGEKWMKDTATSCTIAAALIATVMFAAAFTVPGGVRSDSGIPIFLKETPFIVFAIADSVSMLTSTTSLLLFLSIMTSRYAEQDFLYVLPKRLCIGLLTLFTSITFMMVAFSATTYIILKEKSRLFLIPMAALSCLPVASFVLLQFPLLIAVVYSTYGPSIFRKNSNTILY